MKILIAILAVFTIGAFTDKAEAQCFVQRQCQRQVFTNNVIIPQTVVVPQSTAFFSGGNVAFINQPQAFFTNPVFAQQGFFRRRVVFRQNTFRVISPGLITIR